MRAAPRDAGFSPRLTRFNPLRSSKKKLFVIYGKWTECLWGVEPAAYESFRRQGRRGEPPGAAQAVRPRPHRWARAAGPGGRTQTRRSGAPVSAQGLCVPTVQRVCGPSHSVGRPSPVEWGQGPSVPPGNATLCPPGSRPPCPSPSSAQTRPRASEAIPGVALSARRLLPGAHGPPTRRVLFSR